MKSPSFELSLLNGKKISSEKLIGKPILLDFWASWCAPCVEKLPEAKSLEKEISVFFINTDEKNRVRLADEIISKNDLRNNSVMSGTGEDDVLWKTFARINNSLPFYVLIDEKGVIVYAGSGGEELRDLKNKIAVIKN
jgi:thiol-disulfide isomerase/thioredoxin